MNNSLLSQPPSVVDFAVWQDYMPGPGPRTRPLYAGVVLELHQRVDLSTAHFEAAITLRRADGTQILVAPLDVGPTFEGGTSGGTQFNLSMHVAPPPPGLTEGDSVSGTITLVLATQTIEVPLPEVALMFTY